MRKLLYFFFFRKKSQSNAGIKDRKYKNTSGRRMCTV